MKNHTSKIGRQRILEISEDLFTRRGYRAVSIRDIAQACKVSNAALYYHFPSKDSLFQEVIEMHAHRLRDQMLRAAEKAGTHKEKVMAILNEYALLAAERRSPVFLLRGSHNQGESEHLKGYMSGVIHAILQPLDEVFQQAIEAGEIRRLPQDYSAGALLLGMLHGLVQHKRACYGNELEMEDIKWVVEVLWRGMNNDERKQKE